MGITRPTPPASVVQLAEESLAHVSPQAFKESPTGSRRAQETAYLEEPLLVFCLGLRPVAEDSTLDAAELVAWRFFVMSGNRPVASTEVGVNRQDKPAFWSHTSYDTRIRAQISLIRRAQSDPRYQSGSYEMRFLRIPALDLNGLLWLKGSYGSQDIVIQMTSIGGLRAGWPYSVEKLFSKIRKHAQRRLAASNAPVRGNQA
jgi:hypothetical protein